MSFIRINTSALTPDSSLALGELFKQEEKSVYYFGDYSVKFNDKVYVVSLDAVLYPCMTTLPEFGWSKKKYIVAEFKSFAHGQFGYVFNADNIIKLQNNRWTTINPVHRQVIKRSKIERSLKKAVTNKNNAHKEMMPFSLFSKKAHQEARLQRRVKYSHAKRALLNDDPNNHDHSIVISRKIPGIPLSDLVLKMNYLECLTASLSMIKGYITQIEDSRLIHYDVKPGNFIYDQWANRGKYIDFGFAEKSGSHKSTTKGSPIYQAFETFLGNCPTSKKTDYFSLVRSIQDMLGDKSMSELVEDEDDLFEEEYVLQMVDLYQVRTQGRNIPVDPVIVNFCDLTHLFEDPEFQNKQFYQLLSKEDKDAIKKALLPFLACSMEARPDSLDDLLKTFFLIKLHVQYASVPKAAVAIDDAQLEQYVNTALSVFHKLRHASFTNLTSMKMDILDGINELPDCKEALTIYTDFLELDNIPDFKNKKELCQHIHAVFDAYEERHNRFIHYLRFVSSLMSDKPSLELDNIFFEIYNQLDRQNRSACNLNEIVELGESYKKKLEKISKAFDSYMLYHPASQHTIDAILQGPPVSFTDDQIKVLKKGLKFLRSQHHAGVLSVLDQYKHYAALVLQNCCTLYNDASKAFVNNIVPFINLASRVQPLYKRFKDSKGSTVGTSELVKLLLAYVQVNLSESYTYNEHQFSEAQKIVDVLQNVKNDFDARVAVGPFLTQLTPALQEVMKNTIFSNAARPQSRQINAITDSWVHYQNKNSVRTLRV